MPLCAPDGVAESFGGATTQSTGRIALRARRVRVAICLDNLGIGGTELNAVRTAEQLDRQAIDLHLIALQAAGPLLRRFEAAGVRVNHFQIDGLLSASALSEGRRLARYLRESKIDIVHTHDIYTNVFVAPWARLARVPVVMSSRRWWQSLPERKYRIANRLVYQLSSRVLANCPAVGQSLIRDDGVSSDRVVVVPNFVEESAFTPIPAAERAVMRQAMGIPHDAIVIGSIARLVPVKDHASLLTAVAALAGRYPALRLVLLGDGCCRVALESRARDLGIRDRIHFAGLVHDQRNLHGLFDISALSSLSEGFPNSIVEAMAARRPVVATDVGGTADAVIDGETGYLVAPSSPDRLAGALQLLLDEATLRIRMGAAGEARARENFHVSLVVPRLQQLYQRLAGVLV